MGWLLRAQQVYIRLAVREIVIKRSAKIAQLHDERQLMSWSVEWHDKNRSILKTYLYDEWTWEDFHEATSEAANMIRAVSYPVVLINHSENTHYRPEGNPMPHYRRAGRIFPDNLDLTIIVSGNMMAKYLYRVVSAVFSRFRDSFLIAGSLEQALYMADDHIINTASADVN
jgi:hypothetical protein